MTYKHIYKTPPEFSDILMVSDGEYLTGLYFVGSRNADKHETLCAQKPLPIFSQTARWLDEYFRGREPDFTPPYKLSELTAFRKEVVDILNTIPFGQTVTYGDIAHTLAKGRRMSAQAVGGAVGWNPICIIIPCHRVVGATGALTGYGGGMGNKAALLLHEKKYRNQN